MRIDGDKRQAALSVILNEVKNPYPVPSPVILSKAKNPLIAFEREKQLKGWTRAKKRFDPFYEPDLVGSLQKLVLNWKTGEDGFFDFAAFRSE